MMENRETPISSQPVKEAANFPTRFIQVRCKLLKPKTMFQWHLPPKWQILYWHVFAVGMWHDVAMVQYADLVNGWFVRIIKCIKFTLNRIHHRIYFGSIGLGDALVQPRGSFISCTTRRSISRKNHWITFFASIFGRGLGKMDLLVRVHLRDDHAENESDENVNDVNDAP